VKLNSPHVKRGEKVTDGRVIKKRGNRGGKRKPRGPRTKPMLKVQETLQSIVQAVERPNVIVAPRPKPKPRQTSRRAVERNVERESRVRDREPGGVVKSGEVPLKPELVKESRLLDPEARVQAMGREWKLIKEVPLRTTEVPDSMRLGAICRPSS